MGLCLSCEHDELCHNAHSCHSDRHCYENVRVCYKQEPYRRPPTTVPFTNAPPYPYSSPPSRVSPGYGQQPPQYQNYGRL